jgi:hypothetical protein
MLCEKTFIPTNVAVNLIVHLDIAQNGYDITDDITEVIKRATNKLHNKIKTSWYNFLQIEGPPGALRSIPITDYLDATFSKEELEQAYKFSEICFLTLVTQYNEYKQSCGQPGIVFEDNTSVSEPTKKNNPRVLTDLTQAVTKIVKNITTREKITKVHIEKLFADIIKDIPHHNAIEEASIDILQTIKTELEDCITSGRPQTSVRDKMIKAAFQFASTYHDISESSKLPPQNKMAKEINDPKLSMVDRLLVVDAFRKYIDDRK